MTTPYRWALGFALAFTAAVVLWPFPVVTHHLGTLAAGVGALAAWHFGEKIHAALRGTP